MRRKGALISDGRRENDSFDRAKRLIMDGNSRKSESFEEHLSTDSDGRGGLRESFDVCSSGTKDEMEIDSYGVYNRFREGVSYNTFTNLNRKSVKMSLIDLTFLLILPL